MCISTQTTEGILSIELECNFIQLLKDLEKVDMIKELIQYCSITDHVKIANMLCNSTNEIEKYGLDMLKRLKENELLVDNRKRKNNRRYSQKYEIHKNKLWESLAQHKNDTLQYQIQWFYLDNK